MRYIKAKRTTDGPVGHARITRVFGIEGIGGYGVAKDLTRPVGKFVLVAHHHIEIGTGKIALVFVGRLEDPRHASRSTKRRGRSAQLLNTV